MNDDKRRRLDRTMSKENPTPEDMRVVFDEWLRLGRIAEGLKERVRSHLRFALQRKDELCRPNGGGSSCGAASWAWRSDLLDVRVGDWSQNGPQRRLA